MVGTKEYIQKKTTFEKQLLALSPVSNLSNLINRGFYLPETLKENSVIFVGINPSFNEMEGNKDIGFNYYPFDSSKLHDHDVFKK